MALNIGEGSSYDQIPHKAPAHTIFERGMTVVTLLLNHIQRIHQLRILYPLPSQSRSFRLACFFRLRRRDPLTD